MVDIAEYFENIKYEIKALFFDWGNTVMKVFPEYEGPMVSWPKVEKIEGIEELLNYLFKKYKLVLTSNAQDSDHDLIFQALDRVNLSKYFDYIFTPREIKEMKPAPKYYLNILDHLNIEPENAIMIGDNYEKDIIAAKQVGLWTLWYNYSGQQLQKNSYPYHDMEITNLLDVISIIQTKFK